MQLISNEFRDISIPEIGFCPHFDLFSSGLSPNEYLSKSNFGSSLQGENRVSQVSLIMAVMKHLQICMFDSVLYLQLV